MAVENGVQSLSEVVEEIADAGDRDQVTIREVMASVGRRSFGPLLLVPGLIVMTPIGGVPGVPTGAAVWIVLVAGQILFGHSHVWMPGFLLDRSVQREKLRRSQKVLGPVAHAIDKVVRPRLTGLTEGPMPQVIAACCVALALMMPPLEVVPFANVVTATGISAFGLALVANDGLLVMLALGFLLGACYFLYLALAG